MSQNDGIWYQFPGSGIKGIQLMTKRCMSFSQQIHANPTNGFAQCLRWCMAREARAPKLMEWGRTGTNKWLKVTSEHKVLINGRFPSKFMWSPRCWWFGAIPRYDLSGVGIPTMQGHPGQHLYFICIRGEYYQESHLEGLTVCQSCVLCRFRRGPKRKFCCGVIFLYGPIRL